jgi:MFS family permease
MGLALFYVNATPYLIAITRPQDRNHAFSMQSALISLAGFIGGLLAGFLPGYFATTFAYTLADPAPYRYPLLIAAALIGLGAFATTFMRETAPPEVKRLEVKPVELSNTGRSIFWLIVVLSFVRLLVVSGSGVAMTFFNVYMDAGLRVPTATIGVLMSVSRLLAVPAALITPLLVHRFGNARVTLLASLALSLCLLPLAFSSLWTVAGLGYMSTIAFTSVRYPAFTVYTMEITPPSWRAVMSGAGEMAAGLSFAIIAFVGGLIIATQGYTLLFLAGSILSIAGALLLWLFMRFTRTQAA